MERRKSSRHRVIDEFKVTDLASGQVLGQVIDMSVGGMQVLAEKEADLDTPRYIRVVLPEKTEGKSGIDIMVSCKWCRKAEHTNKYRIGLQIIHMSDSDLGIWRQIINDHEFQTYEIGGE